MSGSVRSAPFRGVLVLGAGLLLLSTFVAVPVFSHSDAAAIPIGSPAFIAQWTSIEPYVPNFWGPPFQNIFPEQYQQASGGPAAGQRFVQYFDKARMEQTTVGGVVTNGLLTVELITGQRQFGDATFTAFSPSSLPVVGDQTNPWPPYAALGGSVFPARVSKSGEPVGTVYKPDGSFALNPGLAAYPGAAFGSYQSDPGGKYGHNLPLAFSAYLDALPIPWQTAMGFPLTEPFWVYVKVATVPTWVMVQPFERRVLSYTPTNPDPFKVEMGNIRQHYYQWRYQTTSPAPDDATGTAPAGTGTIAPTNVTGTPGKAGTAGASGTPGTLAISSVQLGTVSDTTFALSFRTSVAATTEILYGTTSHSYDSRQDVSTTAAQDHTVSLTGLQPGTRYYFTLRATAGGSSVERREDYFSTAGTSVLPTKITKATTAVPIPTVEPTSTGTMVPVKSVHVALTQARVGATNPAQIAPANMQVAGIPSALLESASIAISLSYEGTSGTASNTVALSAWTRDMVNVTATCSGTFSPLTLTDKQVTLVLTATATIPFTDSSSPPLVVTFTRKITPAEYAAGTTIMSSPLNNAKVPGYSVVLTFAASLG